MQRPENAGGGGDGKDSGQKMLAGVGAENTGEKNAGGGID
jgi:hypothetical protein